MKLVRQVSEVVGPIMVDVEDDTGKKDFVHIDEQIEDDPAMPKFSIASSAVFRNDVPEQIIKEAVKRRKSFEKLLDEHQQIVRDVNKRNGSGLHRSNSR